MQQQPIPAQEENGMRQLINASSNRLNRVGRHGARVAVGVVITVASSSVIGNVAAAQSGSIVAGSPLVALDEFEIVDDDQKPKEIIIVVPEKPKPPRPGPLPSCTPYSCPA
jgi:hypothetical protein